MELKSLSLDKICPHQRQTDQTMVMLASLSDAL